MNNNISVQHKIFEKLILSKILPEAEKLICMFSGAIDRNLGLISVIVRTVFCLGRRKIFQFPSAFYRMGTGCHFSGGTAAGVCMVLMDHLHPVLGLRVFGILPTLSHLSQGVVLTTA